MDQEHKDTESLQTRGRRRVTCLDAFLVASIILLFMAVTAMAVVVAMRVMDPGSTEHTGSPAYKVKQNASVFKNQCKNQSLLFHLNHFLPSSCFPPQQMENFVYLEASLSKFVFDQNCYISVHV